MSSLGPIFDFVFTDHALIEMARRQITQEDVKNVLANPEQTEIVREGRAVYQAKREIGVPPGNYLLRVFVDIDCKPPSIVTVYRTSKIEKYWRQVMKVIYDRETDTLTIIFAETPVAESDEDKPGVILDYDDKGNLVSLEILDASRRVNVPSKIEYQVSPLAG